MKKAGEYLKTYCWYCHKETFDGVDVDPAAHEECKDREIERLEAEQKELKEKLRQLERMTERIQ